MKRRTGSSWLLVILVCALLLGIALYGLLNSVTRSASGLSMVNYLIPPLVTGNQLVTNLDSNDRELVYTSLSILARREDPIAIERALKLLGSEDPYVWLNAALYLGACGQKEAIPYLIKGLRHKARRSYSESAANLTKLTGERFGENYHEWHTWWTSRHGSTFDFDSYLERSPKTARGRTTP